MNRELLKTVVLDQTEQRALIAARHIKRDIPYEKLQKTLSAPNILVITGGKTLRKIYVSQLAFLTNYRSCKELRLYQL